MTIRTMGALLAVAGLAVLLAIGGSAAAKGDLSRQKPITVLLTLGSVDNKMIFAPKHLTFETGKLYKLRMTNPSPEKHEVAAPELSETVYTRKVEVVGPTGAVLAEIKGTIREIEVMPGGTVDWYFVPVAAVKSGELLCELPGHKEAGMVGTFTTE